MTGLGRSWESGLEPTLSYLTIVSATEEQNKMPFIRMS